MAAVKRPKRAPARRAPSPAEQVLAANASSVALLWQARGRPTRGPKPGLSVEEIARAAIAIADAEGLEAVSMQRVAQGFGVTPMALYRYVPGKAELIDVMIDVGLADAPALADVPGGWRPRLEAWARRMFAAFVRHPWALAATGSLRVMGPSELAWLESALAALTGTGLSPDEARRAALVVAGHVRISAQFSIGAGAGPRAITGAQWAAATRELLRDRGERFPALHAVLAEDPAPGDPLEFGLACVLDGIAARISRAAT